MKVLQQKMQELNQLLRQYRRVAIGFSGGVDSTFLAAAAYRVLGDAAIALTAYSATLAASEQQDAVNFAAQIGIHHVLLPIDELEDADFVANTARRCYFCKRMRFTQLRDWAGAHGYAWVLEGSNADDCGDYRPGMQAVSELAQVASPLLIVGLTKREIRALAKEWNLPAWDKPSAACLSSRVAYHQPITTQKLRQIEQAEAFIKQFCSGQVRVRHHGPIARVEVDPAMLAVISQPEVRQPVVKKLREIGFHYITLDLSGYHTGSMNRTLPTEERAKG